MIRYKFITTRAKTILWKQTSHLLASEYVPMRGLSGGGTFSPGGDCSQSSFRRRGNFAAFNATWSSSCNSFSYSPGSTTEFGSADSSHFLGLAVAIRACSSAFIVAMRSFLTTSVSFSQVGRKRVYVSIKVTCCSSPEKLYLLMVVAYLNCSLLVGFTNTPVSQAFRQCRIADTTRQINTSLIDSRNLRQVLPLFLGPSK